MTLRMFSQALHELHDRASAVRDVPLGPLLRGPASDELHEAAAALLGGRLQDPLAEAEEIHGLGCQRVSCLRVVPGLTLAVLLHVGHEALQLPQSDTSQLRALDAATRGPGLQLLHRHAHCVRFSSDALDFGASREHDTGARQVALVVQGRVEHLLGGGQRHGVAGRLLGLMQRYTRDAAGCLRLVAAVADASLVVLFVALLDGRRSERVEDGRAHVHGEIQNADVRAIVNSCGAGRCVDELLDALLCEYLWIEDRQSTLEDLSVDEAVTVHVEHAQYVQTREPVHQLLRRQTDRRFRPARELRGAPVQVPRRGGRQPRA
mmetsp:Transcript_140067/g.447976  ORF Transcript_140067/g.447976 Transcript_140067/m.447976 type:complete len:320 (+) Transcript_140067:411-1370(+)